MYAYSARLKPALVKKLLDVVSKDPLNYLLELATKFRELMCKEKELKINAIGFPAVKNPVSEKALGKARENLSGRARKLVDELLRIGEEKPLIITREGAESTLPIIHSIERVNLSEGYLDSFPYLRVEGSLAEIPFGLILEVGKRLGFLEDSDVAEFSKWVNPNTKLLIKPMLRLHGGYPAYTLAVAVIFPSELELEVREVNKLTNKLYPVTRGITVYLFGKGFYNKFREAFKEVLGFKPEFIYADVAPVVFASLDFDKSFEELVKTYPLQIAALATGMSRWWMYSRGSAVKDVRECLVGLYTDGVILTGPRGVVLAKSSTTPRGPLVGFLYPFNIVAILTHDFALTGFAIIDGLSDSLRGGEPEPSVLKGLRKYITRLLGELGGYYRLARSDPFRGIWRNTYRLRELRKAEGELKELLRAIDRGLKRFKEWRSSVMNVLQGALGAVGALIGLLSLWGVNIYTIIVASVLVFVIIILLMLIILYSLHR